MRYWPTIQDERLKSLDLRSSPSLHCEENVTVLPVIRAHVPMRAAAGTRNTACIGAYGSDRRSIRALSLQKRAGFSPPPPYRKAEEFWPGEYVYGGIVWRHFGHFLLEGMSRIAGVRAKPDIPIVWHYIGDRAQMSGWQHEIVNMIGLAGREHRIVDHPVMIERLWFSDQGYVIGKYFDTIHANTMAVHQFLLPTPGRRIWLSRSALHESQKRILGESEVEDLLKLEGWIILHPEQLTVTEQLAALQDAEIISGFEGSAFHILMLARDVRARIVIAAGARSLGYDYSIIGAVKKSDQYVLEIPATPVDRPGGRPLVRIDRPVDVLSGLREIRKDMVSEIIE